MSDSGVSLCRLCRKACDFSINIFNPNGTNGLLVWKIIKELLQLDVCKEDGLPVTICSECMDKVAEFKYFKTMCIASRIEFLKASVSRGLIDSDSSLLQGFPTLSFFSSGSERSTGSFSSTRLNEKPSKGSQGPQNPLSNATDHGSAVSRTGNEAPHQTGSGGAKSSPSSSSGPAGARVGPDSSGKHRKRPLEGSGDSAAKKAKPDGGAPPSSEVGGRGGMPSKDQSHNRQPATSASVKMSNPKVPPSTSVPDSRGVVSHKSSTNAPSATPSGGKPSSKQVSSGVPREIKSSSSGHKNSLSSRDGSPNLQTPGLRHGKDGTAREKTTVQQEKAVVVKTEPKDTHVRKEKFVRSDAETNSRAPHSQKDRIQDGGNVSKAAQKAAHSQKDRARDWEQELSRSKVRKVSSIPKETEVKKSSQWDGKRAIVTVDSDSMGNGSSSSSVVPDPSDWSSDDEGGIGLEDGEEVVVEKGGGEEGEFPCPIKGCGKVCVSFKGLLIHARHVNHPLTQFLNPISKDPPRKSNTSGAVKKSSDHKEVKVVSRKSSLGLVKGTPNPKSKSKPWISDDEDSSSDDESVRPDRPAVKGCRVILQDIIKGETPPGFTQIGRITFKAITETSIDRVSVPETTSGGSGGGGILKYFPVVAAVASKTTSVPGGAAKPLNQKRPSKITSADRSDAPKVSRGNSPTAGKKSSSSIASFLGSSAKKTSSVDSSPRVWSAKHRSEKISTPKVSKREEEPEEYESSICEGESPKKLIVGDAARSESPRRSLTSISKMAVSMGTEEASPSSVKTPKKSSAGASPAFKSPDISPSKLQRQAELLGVRELSVSLEKLPDLVLSNVKGSGKLRGSDGGPGMGKTVDEEEQTFACSYCAMPFTEKVSLGSHVFLEHGLKSCAQCGELLDTEESYKAHMKMHSPKKSALEKSDFEVHCSIMLKSKKKKVATHHGDKSSENGNTSGSDSTEGSEASDEEEEGSRSDESARETVGGDVGEESDSSGKECVDTISKISDEGNSEADHSAPIPESAQESVVGDISEASELLKAGDGADAVCKRSEGPNSGPDNSKLGSESEHVCADGDKASEPLQTVLAEKSSDHKEVKVGSRKSSGLGRGTSNRKVMSKPWISDDEDSSNMRIGPIPESLQESVDGDVSEASELLKAGDGADAVCKRSEGPNSGPDNSKLGSESEHVCADGDKASEPLQTVLAEKSSDHKEVKVGSRKSSGLGRGTSNRKVMSKPWISDDEDSSNMRIGPIPESLQESVDGDVSEASELLKAGDGAVAVSKRSEEPSSGPDNSKLASESVQVSANGDEASEQVQTGLADSKIADETQSDSVSASLLAEEKSVDSKKVSNCNDSDVSVAVEILKTVNEADAVSKTNEEPSSERDDSELASESVQVSANGDEASEQLQTGLADSKIADETQSDSVSASLPAEENSVGSEKVSNCNNIDVSETVEILKTGKGPVSKTNEEPSSKPDDSEPATESVQVSASGDRALEPLKAGKGLDAALKMAREPSSKPDTLELASESLKVSVSDDKASEPSESGEELKAVSKISDETNQQPVSVKVSVDCVEPDDSETSKSGVDLKEDSEVRDKTGHDADLSVSVTESGQVCVNGEDSKASNSSATSPSASKVGNEQEMSDVSIPVAPTGNNSDDGECVSKSNVSDVSETSKTVAESNSDSSSVFLTTREENSVDGDGTSIGDNGDTRGTLKSGLNVSKITAEEEFSDISSDSLPSIADNSFESDKLSNSNNGDVSEKGEGSKNTADETRLDNASASVEEERVDGKKVTNCDKGGVSEASEQSKRDNGPEVLSKVSDKPSSEPNGLVSTPESDGRGEVAVTPKHKSRGGRNCGDRQKSPQVKSETITRRSPRVSPPGKGSSPMKSKRMAYGLRNKDR